MYTREQIDALRAAVRTAVSRNGLSLDGAWAVTSMPEWVWSEVEDVRTAAGLGDAPAAAAAKLAEIRRAVLAEGDDARAIRRLGAGAPVDVLDACARCYAWRPFARHTADERAAHDADVAAVDAYEASLTAPYMGADPMGDEE